MKINQTISIYFSVRFFITPQLFEYTFIYYLILEDTQVTMNDSNEASWYNFIILGLACIGVIVNLCSFIVLARGGKCSMFYKLLKVSRPH